MLVLTRRIGERIWIGKDIVIEVRAIQGKRIKLGIEAEKSVHVLRGELQRAIGPMQRSAVVRCE